MPKFFTSALLLTAKIVLISVLLISCSGKPNPIDYSGPIADWPSIGGHPGGQRFSPLTQITNDNVDQLKVAWTYHTGDVSNGNLKHGPTAFQATPIVVDGAMYFCTPFNRVISLDPETGAELWIYDPAIDLTGVYTPSCRGVSYWQDPQYGSFQQDNNQQDNSQQDSNRSCSSRILTGTLDARLIAIDAKSGNVCKDFGVNGAVNLLDNLGDVRAGEYYVTSAPAIINDLVITGAYVQDGQRVDAPSGVVRAFDVRTGELRWAYDPVPPDSVAITAEQAKAGAIFTRATPNTWGNISVDAQRGIVYLPTGNSQPDHYGGKERGNMDHYGTSVIAVDAMTGKRIWNFQAVHHDIWDWDIAAQPVTFEQHGETPGVIIATKMGHIFLLNRETGEPLFAVEERPVPQTRVTGEYTAPTQPFPTLPKPLQKEIITEDDIWGIYPGDRGKCIEQFNKYDYQGMFTPPSPDEFALLWPGLGGGVNWGSVSVNPQSNILLVNSMRVPYTVKLVPREQAGKLDGSDMVGSSPQEGTPYVVIRGGFLSEHNTPCTAPPWGVLTAINLDTGETLWEKPLGNLKKLAPFGVGGFFNWGTPNTGGTLQTASQLVFVAATLDGYIRAFDTESGDLRWQATLPAPAQATPMSYRLSKTGKQYIAIAAGGHGPLAYAAKGPDKVGELLSDTLVVYSLKDSNED